MSIAYLSKSQRENPKPSPIGKIGFGFSCEYGLNLSKGELIYMGKTFGIVFDLELHGQIRHYPTYALTYFAM